MALALVVRWPFGLLAKALQVRLDEPLLRTMQHVQQPHWTAAMNVVTRMGDRPQVKAVCLVSAAVLAVFWRRR